MNKKKMVRTAIVVLFVFLGLVFANVVRAESPEELSAVDGKLTVYKLERIPVGSYNLPAVDVSNPSTLRELLEIMRKGEGEYFLKKEVTDISWKFGMPVKMQNRYRQTAVIYKDGVWLEPKHLDDLVVTRNDWASSFFLVRIVLLILRASFLNQKYDLSDKSPFVFFATILFLSAIPAYAHLFNTFFIVGYFLFSFASIFVSVVSAICSGYGQSRKITSYRRALFSAAGIIMLSSASFAGKSPEFSSFLVLVCLIGYLTFKVVKITFWSSEPDGFRFPHNMGDQYMD